MKKINIEITATSNISFDLEIYTDNDTIFMPAKSASDIFALIYKYLEINLFSLEEK